MLWFYEVMLGVVIVVLFGRLARWDGENPRIWAPLAGIAWYVPDYFLGPLWAIPAVGALLGALLYRRFSKAPQGGKVR